MVSQVISIDNPCHGHQTEGKNSYYYAHKQCENVEIREWDGKAAPRLLNTQSLTVLEPAEVTEAVSSFVWADGKKRVSVYLKLPGIGSHSVENTHIDWTATSLTVKIKNLDGKTRLFVVAKLYAEISDKDAA
ncbi:unnamed protein product [Hyaloperonospora brassicae]|uniref:CS domain-containing protein n=1 Tax=Hyaloperonospora brassicae TaxID=162125 RepID=A0AAV0UBP3_HYABA|nr:unnamed protein product [Hyaloperonospora brassicae]